MQTPTLETKRVKLTRLTLDNYTELIDIAQENDLI